MWDMQKIIIKAHPTAQLAQPCHATREQVLLSLTPGAFVWAKVWEMCLLSQAQGSSSCGHPAEQKSPSLPQSLALISH